MEKLVIDIGEANLVVEKYEGVEFIVYFQDKESGCVTQDIVTIRQAFKHGNTAGSAVECLVWADANDENYTYRFAIDRFLEDS